LVACHDVLWIDAIHSENSEADIIGVGTAVGSIKTMGLDLDPCLPAIYRLIQIQVVIRIRVTGPEKVNSGIHDA
jgi:hypothetical protein